MPAELSDRVDVGLLGCRREVADRHVFDHALAKRARRSHRGPPVVRGVDETVTSSQTGGFTSAPLPQHRGSRFVQFAAYGARAEKTRARLLPFQLAKRRRSAPWRRIFLHFGAPPP